jgi:hypothetical protein
MSAAGSPLLAAVEERLRAALTTRLGPEIAVLAGPSGPLDASGLPANGVERWVQIAAVALDQPAPVADADGADQREPAFLEETHTLTAAPGAAEWPLPAQAGEPVEVETPPGRLARPGDAWWVDQGRLHFYQAPAGAVAVRTRGGPAQGYRETRPGRVLLHLDTWAPTAAQTDDLMLPALGAVFGSLFDLDLIALGRDAATGFELRLLRPRAQLAGMGRRLAESAGRMLARNRTRLHLWGDLELTLALGSPPAAGIIESIDYRYRRT